MGKMKDVMIALMALSSLLAVEQLMWNSLIVAKVSPQMDQPIIGSSSSSVKQLSQNDIEQRVGRLLRKPTNIYVLGERNSGTNYVAGGKCCFVLFALVAVLDTSR